MAEPDRGVREERFNNRIALTIALLATFLALSTIKAGNVVQAIEQAQAERNNSWAWYQAVRVREDMATYELAGLQRLARGQPPALAPAAPDGEAARLAGELAAQEGELGRVRARKDEVERRARAAESQVAGLAAIDDEYDLSSALIAIATSLLAVCALARVRWLYWFSLLPALSGMGFGAAAMTDLPLNARLLSTVVKWGLPL